VVTPYLEISKSIPYVQEIRQKFKPKYRGQLVLGFMRKLWYLLRLDVFTNTFGDNVLSDESNIKQISRILYKTEKQDDKYFNNLREAIIALAEGIGTANKNIEILVSDAWYYSVKELIGNLKEKGKNKDNIFTDENVEERPSKYGKASAKYKDAIGTFKKDTIPSFIPKKLQKKLIKEQALEENERQFLDLIRQKIDQLI